MEIHKDSNSTPTRLTGESTHINVWPARAGVRMGNVLTSLFDGLREALLIIVLVILLVCLCGIFAVMCAVCVCCPKAKQKKERHSIDKGYSMQRTNPYSGGGGGNFDALLQQELSSQSSNADAYEKQQRQKLIDTAEKLA